QHSQIQPLGIYFSQNTDQFGNINLINKNLGFSKARHYVLSFDHTINKYAKFKTEIYYQDLFNIPVSANKMNSFSTINLINGYPSDSLSNKGTGSNKGIEFSLDKSLNKGFYYLASVSIYDSKYKGSDGFSRNTKWNGQTAFTLTAGRELEVQRKGKQKILGFNIKMIRAGGFRETPINTEASKAKGETVNYDNRAFENQIPAYFRTDIRLSMKTNHKKFVGTLSLDIQNLTNRKNIYGRFYDARTSSVKTYYQTSLIPVLSYKVEF
ncbi:MAG: TonB-dependent receptor, partial [Bacteroidia bacterium]|nr:TonB-dependent receptor [Bacteroidia bacterium]